MIKSNIFLKIYFLIKLFIFFFIITENSYSDNLKVKENMIVMGSHDAIVKIKIFSSLTCPHCANFHTKVVPQIKKEYVESGKVQLIFIDFPLDQAAFNASKLLHCLGQEKQMIFLDTIYEKQEEWTNGPNLEDINNNLKKIVENLGINQIQFNKCLIDEDISDKILNGRIDANMKYSIKATPTIIINEKKLEGAADFKNISKRIEKII